jgi:hypothetical protein
VDYGNEVVLSREQMTALTRLVEEGDARNVTLTATAVEGAVTVLAERRLVLVSRDGRTFDLRGEN